MSAAVSVFFLGLLGTFSGMVVLYVFMRLLSVVAGKLSGEKRQ